MGSEPASERELLRQALSPGKDCPRLETLEQLAAPGSANEELKQHVDSCAYCRTELDLLRIYQTAPRDDAEAEAARIIAGRLRSRLPEITRRSEPATTVQEPWWKRIFQHRWLSPAALAMAGLLIAVAVGIQWRRGAPTISAPNQAEQEVLRSGALTVIAPAGDIEEKPKEIRWQPIPGAALYQVRLLEVDRNELWKTTTAESHIDIPAEIQAQIVPAKTLLLEVRALDAAGRKIAESDLARFRVLRNVYTR